MTLAYARQGNPTSAAIVFLHGNAMGQWMWSDQMRHFADYDCYSVDLPGHGSSSHIPWESFDQTADCIAQLISEEIPGKLVYVVGLSLGAVVGLHLLARHPQRIERAVLTGTFASAPPRSVIRIQGWILSLLLSTTWGRRLFVRTLHLPPEVLPACQQSVDSLSLPAVKRIMRQIAAYTSPPGLEAITVPVLFVTGEHDIAFNRHSVTQLTQRVSGAVGIYAPGMHHNWNSEDPVLFNAMTRAWIEDQPLPPTLIPC
jgi:pimeloyl-ACP methyl ester carboxylesterase